VSDRRWPTVRAAVLPAGRTVADLGRFVPSTRSLVAGFALLAFGGLAYLLALETPLFAVRTIDVRGGTPVIRAEVRAALTEEAGRSLLRVDGAVLTRRLADVADVRSFTYDRAFPHTLRVVVRPERPALILRRVPGKAAYLVSASGRVLRPLAHPERSGLPRLWVTHAVAVTVGAKLAEVEAAAAAAVSVARSVRLPGGVRTVRATSTELTLTLKTGLDVRLGGVGDVRLKLGIARRILAANRGGATGGYLDVSVPERAVLDLNPQVEGRG
jgi:cell division protein FtsQ